MDTHKFQAQPGDGEQRLEAMPFGSSSGECLTGTQRLALLGHMGEFLPFQLWRLDSRYKTFKEQPLQLQPSEHFKRHISITTSGVCSPDALLGAIGAIGENNVMFAIDYPYESSSIAVEFLKSAPLSDTTREKIAWKNAERILKIR